MKTSVNAIYLFVLIFFVGTSCVTTISFPVRYASEISLTEEKPKIVYVNNFDPSKLNLDNEKETEVYYSGAGNVLIGLLETFNEDKNMEFVNLIRWIEITPAIKKAGKNVDIAAKSIGVKYRAKFYGNIENVTRKYYSEKILKKLNDLWQIKTGLKPGNPFC